MNTPPDQTIPPATPTRGASNLMLRVLSALVLIPVALICIWLGSPWFAAMLAIVILAAGAEWRSIAVIERTGLRMLSIMVPLFVLVAGEVAGPAAGLLVLVVGLVLTIGTISAPWNERSWALVAHVHLGLAVVALLYLRLQPGTGLDLVVFLFAMVWMSDIGGYVAGRLVGGPRLAPRISPGKTWAGAVGAAGFVLATAALMAHFAEVPSAPILGIAFVLSLATQCGDLFESWVKRHFDVKDSGTVIPGHGGVLDRIDGLLFAAPALALMTLLFGTDFIVWR